MPSSLGSAGPHLDLCVGEKGELATEEAVWWRGRRDGGCGGRHAANGERQRCGSMAMEEGAGTAPVGGENTREREKEEVKERLIESLFGVNAMTIFGKPKIATLLAIGESLSILAQHLCRLF